MKVIVHKDAEGIRVIVENEAGAMSAITLNVAATGKLAAMLGKCLESHKYSGSITVGQTEVTSSETIDKVLR